MEPEFFGIEQITDEDRTYRGSRFSEVCDAIFANPYQKVWGHADEPPLPVYAVTTRSVLRGVLPFGAPYFFRKATERAVDSHADLRWGPDHKGYRRLLHPNGICLTGLWEITEDNPYSGYFKKGSQALVIGRYSTCCTETRRGHSRSLALVGKLYPTTDPIHSEPLVTANFITQQDLGGDYCDYINEVEVRNAPDTRAWRRGGALPVLLVTGAIFQGVDKEPSQRQLYPIAKLGKPKDEATRAPVGSPFSQPRSASATPPRAHPGGATCARPATWGTMPPTSSTLRATARRSMSAWPKARSWSRRSS